MKTLKNVVRGLYGPISLLFPFANPKPWYLNESISTPTCFTLLSTAPVHRCRAFDSFTRRLRLLVFYVRTYLLTGSYGNHVRWSWNHAPELNTFLSTSRNNIIGSVFVQYAHCRSISQHYCSTYTLLVCNTAPIRQQIDTKPPCYVGVFGNYIKRNISTAAKSALIRDE